MQLLSTEMANQDPLQPMDPTQTMTQLAQFTTLQEATAQAQSQSLATGNSFLGAQVTVSNGSGQAPTTGTVTAIDSSGVASGSPPQLVLNDATQEYPLSSVTLVQYPTPASTTPATTSSSAGTPAASTGQ
jgi:flagellar basal-body rod modification protein FlgD